MMSDMTTMAHGVWTMGHTFTFTGVIAMPDATFGWGKRTEAEGSGTRAGFWYRRKQSTASRQTKN